MLGIFGTLNLATRALSAQRAGTEVAGHNLANVNNAAYARQRVAIETSLPIPTAIGIQGTGADAVRIQQVRDSLIDRQIQNETSVRGWLDSQQRALQNAQANLGQEIDRQANGAEGVASTGGVGGQHGLAEALSDFFNAFQGLSTNPTSLAERQVLVMKAQNLSVQFNQVAFRLDTVNTSLNDAVQTEVADANRLIGNIAQLNKQILTAEIGIGGMANDLRDLRQQRLEELAKLTNFTTVEQPTGAVDIVIDGVTMTTGGVVVEQLEAFDPGTGQLQVRALNSGTVLNLTGGSIQGNIEVRDGALTTLQTNIDQLATELITQVNAVHSSGFDLNGNTGELFFQGADSATIGVNSVLVTDPGRIQAADVAGAPGNNRNALALAQLASQSFVALGNQSFSQHYGQTVAGLGQALSSTNSQLSNQQIVEQMLLQQRDSVSGVSIDEEMTDLMKYQSAFEASARLVSTLDEMLTTLVNLGR